MGKKINLKLYIKKWTEGPAEEKMPLTMLCCP